MMSKRTNKDEFWREQIKMQQNSGLTQKDYCHKNAINPKTFSTMKSMLNKSSPKQMRSNFIDIDASNKKVSITICGGHQLTFELKNKPLLRRVN